MPEYSKRKYILELGENVLVQFSSIFKSPHIKIDDNTRINGPINIRGEGKCSIGKYCAIGYDVKILTSDHEHIYPNLQVAMHEKMNFSKSITSKTKGVVIGHNVRISDGATLLGNINIGNGALIATESVVTMDVPKYGIVAGNPAKLIKYRFEEGIVKYMEELKWWDWDKNKIQNNKSFFSTDLSLASSKSISKSIIKD
ncbi:CatB-related O-acetyltransferase [bacterium]|jgi:virginiamycin A acetyltransferase|nr:CatB-related O-acetyltransferase [bacterium]